MTCQRAARPAKEPLLHPASPCLISPPAKTLRTGTRNAARLPAERAACPYFLRGRRAELVGQLQDFQPLRERRALEVRRDPLELGDRVRAARAIARREMNAVAA